MRIGSIITVHIGILIIKLTTTNRGIIMRTATIKKFYELAENQKVQALNLWSIDYEALGRDHRFESNGTFSNIGWVEVY